jgi:hypothetical protein
LVNLPAPCVGSGVPSAKPTEILTPTAKLFYQGVRANYFATDDTFLWEISGFSGFTSYIKIKIRCAKVCSVQKYIKKRHFIKKKNTFHSFALPVSLNVYSNHIIPISWCTTGARIKTVMGNGSTSTDFTVLEQQPQVA